VRFRIQRCTGVCWQNSFLLPLPLNLPMYIGRLRNGKYPLIKFSVTSWDLKVPLGGFRGREIKAASVKFVNNWN
jgi:hypothetical protein